MDVFNISKGKKSFHQKIVNKHLSILRKKIIETLNECAETKYDYGIDTFDYRKIKIVILLQDNGSFDTNQVISKMIDKGYNLFLSEKILFGEEISDYGLNDFAEEIGLEYDEWYSYSQELLLSNIRVFELVWEF